MTSEITLLYCNYVLMSDTVLSGDAHVWAMNGACGGILIKRGGTRFSTHNFAEM